MLTEKLKERLMANWGDRADCLACNAEARIYDDNSSWECYLLAINPENEDEGIGIIVYGNKISQDDTIFMPFLWERFNSQGEFMQWDESFVPRNAYELIKTLKERNP